LETHASFADNVNCGFALDNGLPITMHPPALKQKVQQINVGFPTAETLAVDVVFKGSLDFKLTRTEREQQLDNVSVICRHHQNIVTQI